MFTRASLTEEQEIVFTVGLWVPLWGLRNKKLDLVLDL